MQGHSGWASSHVLQIFLASSQASRQGHRRDQRGECSPEEWLEHTSAVYLSALHPETQRGGGKAGFPVSPPRFASSDFPRERPRAHRGEKWRPGPSSTLAGAWGGREPHVLGGRGAAAGLAEMPGG